MSFKAFWWKNKIGFPTCRWSMWKITPVCLTKTVLVEPGHFLTSLFDLCWVLTWHHHSSWGSRQTEKCHWYLLSGCWLLVFWRGANFVSSEGSRDIFGQLVWSVLFSHFGITYPAEWFGGVVNTKRLVCFSNFSFLCCASRSWCCLEFQFPRLPSICDIDPRLKKWWTWSTVLDGVLELELVGNYRKSREVQIMRWVPIGCWLSPSWKCLKPSRCPLSCELISIITFFSQLVWSLLGVRRLTKVVELIQSVFPIGFWC